MYQCIVFLVLHTKSISSWLASWYFEHHPKRTERWMINQHIL
jgi:hypothetical protein